MEYQDHDFQLRIVELDKVHLHEETIPEQIMEIVRSLSEDRVQLDPIMIDKNSMVILDGNHRLEALRTLNAERVLVSMVDYNQRSLKVHRRLRCIKRINDSMISDLGKKFTFEQTTIENGKSLIDLLKKPLSLITRRSSYVCNLPFNDVIDAYSLVRIFDKIMIENKFIVDPLSENLAFERLWTTYSAFLYTPPIRKEHVIESGLKNRLFPAKSTNHLFPIRPVGIAFPLDSLMGYSVTLEDAQEELQEISSISERTLMPPGGIYRNRAYEDTLLIFHRRAR